MKKFIGCIIISILILSIFVPAFHFSNSMKVEGAMIGFDVEDGMKYTIITGEKISLYVQTSKTVKWSSSNKSVATVSKKGVVKGKKPGKVKITASVGKKKYKCTVIVLDPEKLEKDSMAGANTSESNRDFVSDDVVVPTDAPEEYDPNSDEDFMLMLKYGFASSEDLHTEIGKAYVKFCKDWVSEYELNNSYGISVVYGYENLVYIIGDDNYILQNAPDEFESGKVYSDNGISYQYLDKFEYNDKSYDKQQLYFNRTDLINKGIIK